MDDATLKRLGIRSGMSGKQPRMRFWAKHGTTRIEALAVQASNRLEVRVGGKTTRTKLFNTPELAAAKYFWAQYWARNAVDQFVLKLIKKVTAAKRRSGAIPKEPKVGISFYTAGGKSVVLAFAPEGLARFSGSMSATSFVVARATWKKGATSADAQKIAAQLLKDGYQLTKPPKGVASSLGWRLKNLRAH
jgi:hypothetical protein